MIFSEEKENVIRKSLKKNITGAAKIFKCIQKEKDDIKKAVLCSQAAIFISNNSCGILNSREIEEALQGISGRHSAKQTLEFEKDSFLHVMTRCYATGGHTRIVERWIGASDSKEKHSVALLSQGSRDVPHYFSEVARSRGGDVLRIEAENPLDKALKLRSISSKFEYIILHVHQYDIVPLLSFGTNEFRRPVIFYNHAESLFWIGVSIADLVVNFRDLDSEVSRKYRGVMNNATISLPLENYDSKTLTIKEKENLKKSLGFKNTDKVIITMSSSYKFLSEDNLCYLSFISNFLKKHKEIVVLVIGPSRRERKWNNLYKETKGRCVAIGEVPNSEIFKYAAIADVAVNSFPLSSPTSLMDLARKGVPCLSLETPPARFRIFEESRVFCKTLAELEERIIDTISAKKNINILQEKLKEEECSDNFIEGIKYHIRKLEKKHKVRDFKQDTREKMTSHEEWLFYNGLIKKRSMKSRGIRLIRKVVLLYVRFIYPVGIRKKMYEFLSSYGLI